MKYPSKPRKRIEQTLSGKDFNTAKKMFDWLFAYLKEKQPLVAVTPDLEADIEEAREAILKGYVISEFALDPVWILSQVNWRDTTDPDLPCYGADLLGFLASLGMAIRDQRGSGVLLERAVDLMLDYQSDDKACLRIEEVDDHDWIVTNERGQAVFGRKMRLRLVNHHNGDGYLGGAFKDLDGRYRSPKM